MVFNFNSRYLELTPSSRVTFRADGLPTCRNSPAPHTAATQQMPYGVPDLQMNMGGKIRLIAGLTDLRRLRAALTAKTD